MGNQSSSGLSSEERKKKHQQQKKKKKRYRHQQQQHHQDQNTNTAAGGGDNSGKNTRLRTEETKTVTPRTTATMESVSEDHVNTNTTTSPTNDNNKNNHNHNNNTNTNAAGLSQILWEDDPDEAKVYPRQAPSGRSVATSTSCGSHHLKSRSLRGNLMRQQKEGRSPLDYYEVVQVLGVGSMGSVSKVKKKEHVVGGSAREELQEGDEDEKSVFCFNLPLFQICFGANNKKDKSASWRKKNRRHQPLLVIEPNTSENNDAISAVTSPSTPTSQKQRRASVPIIPTHKRKRNNSRNVSFVNNEPAADSSSDYDGSNGAAGAHTMITQSERSYRSYGSRTSSSARKSEPQQEFYYAMKSIHLNRVADPTFVEELKNEIEILKSLDHPHIVRPIETFEHFQQLFVVMELCSGGDLYSRDPYTEEEAARIIHSILSAVTYMHENNVIHRDLKYENCLFVSTSPTSEVKLIDFGLSKAYSTKSGQTLTEGVGTIYTMAPEVLKGSYTSQADLWSIGVLAYMLLSSQMPFYGKKRRHIVEQIVKCQYNMDGRKWKRISKQGKAFVQDLLVLNPDERLTAEEASSSNWLNRRYGATTRPPAAEQMDTIQQSIKTYSDYSKMKKLALTVIAHKSTSEEIGVLRKVFQHYDTKRNGVITYSEFKAGLTDYGYSDDELEELFEAIDLDGTGKIRYTEFIAATIEARGIINEERLAEAFDRLDEDDSGYITVKNLRQILGEDMDNEEIEQMIDEVDINNDGKIAYHEFLALWEDKEEDKRTTELAEMFPRISSHSSCDLPHQLELNTEEQQRLESLQSVLTTEESPNDTNNQDNTGETIARANFLKAKIHSERKAAILEKTEIVDISTMEKVITAEPIEAEKIINDAIEASKINMPFSFLEGE